KLVNPLSVGLRVRGFGKSPEPPADGLGYPRCIHTRFVTRAVRNYFAARRACAWCRSSSGMQTCRRRLDTPRSRRRIFGRRWTRSTTRGNEIGIHIPPPKGIKFRGENHHEITVVAPTGFEPVFGRGHVFASRITWFSTRRFAERRRD